MKQRPYRTYQGKRRRWPWIVGGLLALAILCFCVLEGIVIAGSRTQVKQQPDMMLVLGAQVRPDGPSVLLADRLQTALEYLRQHPDLPVMVSGGQGPDEPTTEAQAMRDYLVAGGIDPGRISQEGASHNTSQNFKCTIKKLEEQGLDPEKAHLLVVSNGFHLARARLLAWRNGLDISTLAAPASHAPSRLYSYLRESLGLVKSFVFDH